MKGARLINSLTLTLGELHSTISTRFAPDSSQIAHEMGVWWTMGCHRHDDRIPDAHVLLMDMPLVL
jgi:hypothetical protein